MGVGVGLSSWDIQKLSSLDLNESTESTSTSNDNTSGSIRVEWITVLPVAVLYVD